MTTTVSPIQQNYFQDWQQRQKEVSAICQQLQNILKGIKTTGYSRSIEAIEQRLNSDSFNVLIVGEFSAGKSSLINALLGKKLLPVYSTPCTATICEVKWGETPKAILHFKTPPNTPQQTKVVPLEELERHVVTNDDLTNKRIVHDNPYSCVEIFYPLSLCRHGVILIDSAGMNDSSIRERVTTSYLPKVDAVLVVLPSDSLASQSQLNFIDNMLRGNGHEDLFFICNRFDQIDEDERSRFKQYAYAQLTHRTRRGSQGIFFVSAKNALLGKQRSDRYLVEDSGLPHLEQSLEKFLATERGDVRLRQVSREMSRLIREGRKAIPETMAMLQTDFATLERRVQEAQHPLHLLKAKHDNIIKRIETFRGDVKQLVVEKAKGFYRDSGSKVDSWLKDYKPENKIKVFLGEDLQKQTESVTHEISEYLATKIQESLSQWQQTELQPIVENSFNNLKGDLDDRLQEFFNQVDHIRFELATDTKIAPENQPKVSTLDRVLSTMAGFYFMSPGAAFVAYKLGWRELVKGILPQLTVGVAATILLGSNPIGILAAMSAAEMLRLVGVGNEITKKIKESVGKRYTSALIESSYERACQTAASVDQKLVQIQTAVSQALMQEIQSIHDRVDTVMSEKQKGQTHVESRLQELTLLSAKLDAIESNLETLFPESA